MILIKCDYSASPNLSNKRTGTGHAYTHAVLEIFVSYEDTRVVEIEHPDGVKRPHLFSTVKSHQFIGGSESKGKKNNWMFHIDCLRFLIKKLTQQRVDSGREPAKEVVVVTDRCPSQYLCRQNALQVAKYSCVDDDCLPVELGLKHLFAGVNRFKGGHDAEGKVTKMANESNALKNKRGATAWDFYVSVSESCSFEDNFEKSKELEANGCPSLLKSDGMHQINARYYYFVAYEEDTYNARNVGAHEGKIVLANMNNTDDIPPLHSTNKLYMVRGFPASAEPLVTHKIPDEMIAPLRSKLYDIELRSKDNEDNDQFMARFDNDEAGENPSHREAARLDFLNIESGDLHKDDLSGALGDMSPEYIDEFLLRAGAGKVKKRPNKQKMGNVKQWLDADRIKWLYMFRKKKKNGEFV